MIVRSMGKPLLPAAEFCEVALVRPSGQVALADITYVVQKTRAVEFFLRPPPAFGQRDEAAAKAGVKMPSP
jgi:hypothetical protein